MHVDPLATAVILLVLASVMATALVDAARRQPRPLAPALRQWAFALIAGPLGWCLLELAGEVLPPAWAVLAKPLIMTAFIGHLHAVLVLRGHIAPAAWQYLPVLAVALATLGWYVLSPETPMRTGLLSLMCALAAAATAVSCLGDVPRRRRLDVPMGLLATSFGLSALLLGGRAAILLLAPENARQRIWLAQPTSHSLVLGLALLGPLTATLAFVLAGTERAVRRWHRQATVDDLTGAASRTAFIEAAQRRLRRAAPGKACLLLVDLDGFKSINDRHGHATGDRALAALVACLERYLRPRDLIGRLGGDEFAVLISGGDAGAGPAIAERIRRGVQHECARDDLADLTVSIGLARNRAGDDLDSMRERADRALYLAKAGGRNRSVQCPEEHAGASLQSRWPDVAGAGGS
ncbi:MAG: GGDEF domain-containing protein [Xanthomonadales bacterium]|nr:GGDEF domain-containing protein [Xanthomonadales bacterium]